MTVDSNVGANTSNGEGGNWLEDTLRQFNFVTVLRERAQIRRTCFESLATYQRLSAAMPLASKTDIYQRLIEMRGPHDPAAARDILKRAEESFAQWPVERELTLRDLVAYLAVTECMSANPKAKGVRSEVIGVVAGAIPEDY